MAEVIGTVAAAVQLAALATTARNLRRLWRDIQNSPQEVTELVEEVILYADLLGSLDCPSLSGTANPHASTWSRCYELFSSRVESFQSLASELEFTLNKHKRTAGVRLYLKKDQVKRCREFLQQAHPVLQLAQQAALCHASESLRRDNIKLLDDVQTLQKQLQRRHNAAKRKRKRRSGPEASTKRKDNDGRAVSHHSPWLTSNNTTCYTFRFPRLTVWTAWQILMLRSSSSFTIRFRMYNIRPNDSEVFTAAHKGHWRDVYDMFSRGKAAATDVDEWGTTLLHIAAAQANHKVCRSLIEKDGLDASRGGKNSKNPLEVLATVYRLPYDIQPSEKDVVETVRLLIPRSFDTEAHPDYDHKRWSHGCSLPSKAVSALLAVQIPSNKSHETVVRLARAFSSIALDVNTVSLLLGQDMDIESAYAKSMTTKGLGHVHQRLLKNTVRCVAQLNLKDERRTGWLRLLSKIVLLESRNTAKTLYRSTYVQYIASYLNTRGKKSPRVGDQDWNDTLTGIGRNWLLILKRCGADLERYGRAEEATLAFPEWIVWKDGKGRDCSVQVRYMEHGPSVGDWKLFVIPYVHRYFETDRRIVSKGHAEYENAGDFWKLVENPVRCSMPGAFVEGEQAAQKVTIGRGVKINGPIF